VAFFRVIQGFMVQLGIHGDGKVNAVWRNARIDDDETGKASNTRGMVSFATAGPNTRTSQFFINFEDNSRLDRMGFAPFGKVRDMAVVDKLYNGYGEGAPRGAGPDQGEHAGAGQRLPAREASPSSTTSRRPPSCPDRRHALHGRPLHRLSPGPPVSGPEPRGHRWEAAHEACRSRPHCAPRRPTSGSAAAPASPAEGERKTRYSLPSRLQSASPVGYRTRLSFTPCAEAEQAVQLLSMTRPTGFAPTAPVTEQQLFEEASLGVLSARQSTNFRGFRQVTFGPEKSEEIRSLLAMLNAREAEPLAGAAYTHLVLGRPYRNPFTMLLTLVGHRPGLSPFSVATARLFQKRTRFIDDIPTIGYLPHLHTGILADAMERAAVIASVGERRALGFMAPFCGAAQKANKSAIRALEKLCGLTAAERAIGMGLALAVQVGGALPEERIPLTPEAARRIGANLLAFRSERIQPGVNQEDTAPPAYQGRQDMDVSPALTEMAGRAGYNAFTHWVPVARDRSKSLLLVDRIDVLTPGGKARLRAIRGNNNAITDRVIKEMPLWADLPTGRAFSRNAERGRKAFALVGQRIYIGGLSQPEVESAGLDWHAAVRAVGAAASRSALYAELMGATEIPEGCDLLAGVCLMAGPVNQNDIGKTYYGMPDLLADTWPDRSPTSLLVWTLKAKTVADPIGNEEQLLNDKRKGALVDLRPAPHEVVAVAQGGKRVPLRQKGKQINEERAFGDQGNFVRDPDGRGIPGNEGAAWAGSERPVWG
jgi:cyclophilin family peptidyl-prolyl cis-trans isomerase